MALVINATLRSGAVVVKQRESCAIELF